MSSNKTENSDSSGASPVPPEGLPTLPPQQERKNRVKPSRRVPEIVPISARIAAFVLTVGLLAIVQLVVDNAMLIAERFVTHAGWLQIGLLGVYASWAIGMLYPRKQTALWRRRLWTLFSVVFFAQLVIGLSGLERFLMSGELHLPIPAMIVAGPLYRGEGLFMPILFGVTVLLVGPAWCSYLCYIGSWDLNAAQRQKRPGFLPKRNTWIRVGILVVVIASAVSLRLLGVNSLAATLMGAGFGLVGLMVILLISSRMGTMAHCASYCPIGLVADILGKLSPFRLRISDGCTECGACSHKCRYDALRPEQIRARTPGLSCTLCGDCLSSCKGGSIQYALGGRAFPAARSVFLVAVVSFHAVFLGVARI